jgi:hypothetical protein
MALLIFDVVVFFAALWASKNKRARLPGITHRDAKAGKGQLLRKHPLVVEILESRPRR